MIKNGLWRCIGFAAGTVVVLTFSTITLASKPLLHPLFSNHMVLQRDREVPLWGWAEPGDVIRIRLRDDNDVALEHVTRVDASGKWQVRLQPLPAGGPYQLTLSSRQQTLTRNDIAVGDVWFCSGQSNMDRSIAWAAEVNGDPDILQGANNGAIRLFGVPRAYAYSPQSQFAGQPRWQRLSPQSAAEFSAVCYFFGSAMQQHIDIPIGLIQASWGGTLIEAWTSAEGLGDFPQLLETLPTVCDNGDGRCAENRLARWWRDNDRGSDAARGEPWYAPTFNDSNWPMVDLTMPWEQLGLGEFNGAVWYRKKIVLPGDFLSQYFNGATATLSLGMIDDRDTTWINGVAVGATDDYRTERNYRIPAKLLRPGENTIAVRVLDTGGRGGFRGVPQSFVLNLDGGLSLALGDTWRYKAGVKFTETPAIFNVKNTPTVLFNGMVAPLLSYAFKGAVWYQGEANTGRPRQYRKLLPALIADWRSKFQQPLPFLITQLPNFEAKSGEDWPELREAQRLAAAADPLVGLAVTIDLGEADDIHPKNKRDVGERLAWWALDHIYGKTLPSSGPVFHSLTVKHNRIVVAFDHIGDGLVKRGDKPLQGFSLCNRTCVIASARLQGDRVVIDFAGSALSDEWRDTELRYAWSNNPRINLFNSAGLPAMPFKAHISHWL